MFKFLVTLIVAILRRALSFDVSKAIAAKIVQKLTLENSNNGNFFGQVANEASWQLQDYVAHALSLPRCEFCHWVVYPNDPEQHVYCDDELSGKHDPDADLDSWERYGRELGDALKDFNEIITSDSQVELDEYGDDFDEPEDEDIQADWDAYYDTLDAEADDAMNNAICPCGHPGHKHEGAYCDGHCTVIGCDCPQFGEPVGNYETYTKVYLGDPGDDMGMIAWE